MELNIVYLNIDELTPYEKNAKKHPQKQINYIANSIEKFGMDDPIGIWGENNIIVEGHGRLEACKKLGMKKVPCIRLDHLTDEERRAYTLAHNKVAESDFDFDILDEEINSLFDFDMEDFGFHFVTEEEHEKHKETTQNRCGKILNLDAGQFDGVGKYDIPKLKPVTRLPEIREWIGFNYVLSDTEPEGKGVHFFVNDYQFERLWNNPEKYVEKLSKYAAVCTPDFSPYADMPLATQIFNHYRKHWVGAYLQANGVTVIPTIRASRDERSLDFFLDGEPKGGIVCISSMWTRDADARKYFIEKEYKTMYETLKPKKIFVYGKEIESLEGDIEYIENFTTKRWGK